MRMRSLPLALGLVTAPLPALACGGLFCNAVTPVNQAAERILFAVDGEQVHMHVRITYQGPPTDFGWLLPAPRGVADRVAVIWAGWRGRAWAYQ